MGVGGPHTYQALWRFAPVYLARDSTKCMIVAWIVLITSFPHLCLKGVGGGVPMHSFPTIEVWVVFFSVFAVLTLLLSFRTYMRFRHVEDERTRRRRTMVGIVGVVFLVGLAFALPIFMASMPRVP